MISVLPFCFFCVRPFACYLFVSCVFCWRRESEKIINIELEELLMRLKTVKSTYVSDVAMSRGLVGNCMGSFLTSDL